MSIWVWLIIGGILYYLINGDVKMPNFNKKTQDGVVTIASSAGHKWFKPLVSVVIVIVLYLTWDTINPLLTELFTKSDAGEIFPIEAETISKWLFVIGLLIAVLVIRIGFRERQGGGGKKAGGSSDWGGTLIVLAILLPVGFAIFAALSGAMSFFGVWDDVAVAVHGQEAAVVSTAACTTQEDVDAWGSNSRVITPKLLVVCRNSRRLTLFAMDGERLVLTDSRGLVTITDERKQALWGYYVLPNPIVFQSMPGVKMVTVTVTSVPR